MGRLDGQFIDGRPPFYDLSGVQLRGFLKGKYADKHAVTAQAEVRWRLMERWTAALFGGGGRTARKLDEFADSPTEYAGGVGIYYTIAREQNLNVGVNFAYDGDEVTFYIVIGDWLAN